MATAADRLFEIALDEISQQRAIVERARTAVAPVSAAAIAIAAALVKPAFDASGLWPNRCAVIGIAGAIGVLVCSVVVLLEPLGRLELVLKSEALRSNEIVQRSLGDATGFQLALSKWIGTTFITKNRGGLLRVRIISTAMLLAFAIEATGLALAAILPPPAKPPCGASTHPCAKTPSGLALTSLLMGVAGNLQLRGQLDRPAAGSLSVLVVYNRGLAGRATLSTPIRGGRFAAVADPTSHRHQVCSAQYKIAYPGSTTVAAGTITGQIEIPCRGRHPWSAPANGGWMHPPSHLWQSAEERRTLLRNGLRTYPQRGASG